jgi:hypothetical protein
MKSSGHDYELHLGGAGYSGITRLDALNEAVPALSP